MNTDQLIAFAGVGIAFVMGAWQIVRETRRDRREAEQDRQDELDDLNRRWQERVWELEDQLRSPDSRPRRRDDHD